MTWHMIDEAISKAKRRMQEEKSEKHRQAQALHKEIINDFTPFAFAPFSKKQKQLLSWWCDASCVEKANGIIADGSIRSGKTLCLSLSFCLWAMTRFDNQNFALCGKTVSSLRRNVLLGLKHMLRSCGYTVQERRTDNVIIVSKGKQSNRFYLFGGKDERSQDLIQGITLAGVLFDEVALMPESFVNQATARCSVMGSKWWFNCNPDSPFHWFYKEWICHKVDKNLLYLHFTMDDNPSLSKEIKKRYQSLYTGVFFDRFVRGLWVVADGLVYPMVAENKERFLISETQVIDGRYYISIDYGTHNPFSMGLWCVRGNVAMRVREWYHDSRKAKHQLTDEEYYEALENFAKGVLVQRIVIDPSAASFIATIRRHGKFTVRKAENDVLNGIRVTAALLQGGKVKISPLCKDTLREFTLYRWDEQSTDHDAVVKQDDHAMDEIRYFCATILAREFRWIEWR